MTKIVQKINNIKIILRDIEILRDKLCRIINNNDNSKKIAKMNVALNHILEVVKKVYYENKTYQEAIRIVAQYFGVNNTTIRDQTTRRIGLNAKEFMELLEDRNRLINFLLDKFPENEHIIIDILSKNSN